MMSLATGGALPPVQLPPVLQLASVAPVQVSVAADAARTPEPRTIAATTGVAARASQRRETRRDNDCQTGTAATEFRRMFALRAKELCNNDRLATGTSDQL